MSPKNSSFVFLFIVSFGLLAVLFQLGQESVEPSVARSTKEVGPERKRLSPARARLKKAGLSEAGLASSIEERVSPGLTLINAEGTAEARLINSRGEIVHRWSSDVMRARLLPNCHLLVIHGSKWGIANKPWGELSQYVREYDWDGNLVWEYQPTKKPHHDIHRLENGNTLFLQYARVPEELRIKSKDPIKRDGVMRSDSILEVSPDGSIVWSWNFWDHFDVNSCGRADCPMLPPSVLEGRERYKFDWSHVNTTAPLPANRHFDAGDERFRPGNILVLPRNWSAVYLIDKSTGEPVWHYFGDYKGGLRSGHEAQMIEKGLPGAGNILIFDNGVKVGNKGPASSHILEIDPISKEVLWVYDVGFDFFSHAAGSVQRLPNGNTLISEDVRGRTFEVTPSGELVWEYLSGSRIARSHRYGFDFCPKLERFRD